MKKIKIASKLITCLGIVLYILILSSCATEDDTVLLENEFENATGINPVSVDATTSWEQSHNNRTTTVPGDPQVVYCGTTEYVCIPVVQLNPPRNRKKKITTIYNFNNHGDAIKFAAYVVLSLSINPDSCRGTYSSEIIPNENGTAKVKVCIRPSADCMGDEFCFKTNRKPDEAWIEVLGEEDPQELDIVLCAEHQHQEF